MVGRTTLQLGLLMSLACAAHAADLGIRGTRLKVKLDGKGKGAVTFSSHNDAGIQKGPAGLATNLDGTFEVFYTDDPGNRSQFVLSSGTNWLANSGSRAEYGNRAAPTGGGVRRVLLINGKRLRVRARSLGDNRYWKLDLTSGAPSMAGGITTILTIHNGTDASVHRMCTRFAAANGSTVRSVSTRYGGHRLVATHGVPVSCDRLSYFRMEPGLQRGFFAAPWPNDTRLLGDGSLDTAGYPLPSSSLAQQIRTSATSVTKGFGTNSAVFFQACVPIDPSTLPSPEASVLPDSTVMLVNLDAPSDPRVPLLLDAKNAPGLIRPPELLSVLPYPGHPLAGQTRYAVIVFRGITSLEGTSFSAAPLLATLDDPWDASKPVDATKWAALKAQRDAVYSYVDGYTSWTHADVIAFTVYTTQDVLSQMQAIAAAVDALPSPTPISRTTGNCSGGAKRTTVTGQLNLPHWQAGVFPYLYSGGDVVIVGGQAVQQSSETANFKMTFPCGPAPAAGWPILLFMDGTGAGPNSSNISEMGGASSTNPLPYVVASIAPLYSGDRYVCGLPIPFDQSEFLYFNYLNALAGRTNQLQQAGDMIYLRRVIEGIELSAAETGNAAPVPTDDSIEVIGGHSQGALTIPQVLAVDTAFRGGFISAGGGGLYQTVLHRGDVREPLKAFLGPSIDELDMFHPMVHLLQTFAEIGDAANYAPHVQTAHVLSTSGLIDGCSPVEVGSILGTALGLEVANPLYYPVYGSATFETPTTTLPVSGNLAGGRTGVTVQLDAGHFGAATNPSLGRSFADSLATGGVPTVNASSLLSDTVEGCPRYDPLP
jgi:hypothetical protein